MVNGIEFISGGVELLEDVRPLWVKLMEHHRERAVNFKEWYSDLTFEKRVRKFTREGVRLRIVLARDAATGVHAGYCVSTIHDEAGELDSLFIEEAYRRRGIGGELVKMSVAWLGEGGVGSKIITVAEGNEEAIGFYEKFGFKKRLTVLMEATEPRK